MFKIIDLFVNELLQKGPDYGALIIKGSAGVVITISLALIFLVVGNMVYQTFTNKMVPRQKVCYHFVNLIFLLLLFKLNFDTYHH